MRLLTKVKFVKITQSNNRYTFYYEISSANETVKADWSIAISVVNGKKCYPFYGSEG
jgi:hypothetical protein